MSTQTQIVPEPERLNSIACTKCGSAEVRRLSLIYEEGLSHSAGQSQTAFGGGGFGTTASTFSTSTSQTALSKKAAPPTKKHTILLAMLAGFLGFCTVAGIANFSFWALVFGGLTYLVVMKTLKAKAYNAMSFPEERARWERSFMCNRCGGVFAV
jgi:hypothetical protein